MYARLNAMDKVDAAKYVYLNYASLKNDAGAQRWIGENAALYADVVKGMRPTPKDGG